MADGFRYESEELTDEELLELHKENTGGYITRRAEALTHLVGRRIITTDPELYEKWVRAASYCEGTFEKRFGWALRGQVTGSRGPAQVSLL